MDADIIIVGGGHAGCEAALSSARLGNKTILFAINLDSIALMPCNPNIGGTSKGHLVREIDALGGEMGKNIDKTYIQSRMLNLGKGPAVHSLRAQADKNKYAYEMKRVLETTDNLIIKQNECIEILVENNIVTGIKTEIGKVYNAKAVILCAGTYLNSRCLCGEVITETGPNGLKNSKKLSESLKNLGISLRRFKTGTPARVDKRFIDFDKMQIQNGDENIIPFSFSNTKEDIKKEQVPCYLTYTNEKTHDIIKNNLHRSPMYSGVIEGTGARYCPSIEDKVVRFSDKERHQIFIEPEGIDTTEMYVQGLSTSLPGDVQEQYYRTVPGLEDCVIMRYGYAIEYDCIDATELNLSLEFKHIKGLFSAGQLNGSSGYEEAAAQGLMAGINASLMLQNKEPLILKRWEAYIGVLIDDLVTKGTNEPYRMMTSRAEYRLLLRQDNADLRLTEKGYEVGLVKQQMYDKFLQKKSNIQNELDRVRKFTVTLKSGINDILAFYNTAPLNQGVPMAEIIKRSEIDYKYLESIDPERPSLTDAEIEQINIQIKYEGYIERQIAQVKQLKKLENKKIPDDFSYDNIQGLRIEAKEKLMRIRPSNIGHASRISGVSSGDISVLLIYLEKFKTLL